MFIGDDQTEFSCQFCDKSYKFKGDLTRHIILKHTEDDFENSEENQGKEVDPIGNNTGSNAELKPGTFVIILICIIFIFLD